MRTFPFSSPHNAMLTMLVCSIRWLSMHLYTLTYMFMYKSCLLVCRPYFNTIKLWTFDPNLHLSLTDTTFCLLSCMFAFACTLVYFIPLVPYLRISFFPLLVYWFLVSTFACAHMKRGRMALRHGFPSASKKGKDASMWI